MQLLHSLRAARVDDFVSTLREVHKVFQWPFPVVYSETAINDTISPTSTIKSQSPKDTPIHSTPLTPVKAINSTLSILANEAPVLDSSNEAEGMAASLKRPNRPPDLDLTPAHTVAILRTTAQGTQQYSISLSNVATGNQSYTDALRSSTPSKRSGSVSERVSLVMKPNACEFFASLTHTCAHATHTQPKSNIHMHTLVQPHLISMLNAALLAIYWRNLTGNSTRKLLCQSRKRKSQPKDLLKLRRKSGQYECL